ncbi:MAG: hypothetical protein ABI380_01745, partial [Edaphobacter sp.]
VSHACCGRGTVPMLFSSLKPYRIARMDFFYWAAFTLNPAATRSDENGLPEGGAYARQFVRPAQKSRCQQSYGLVRSP